MIGGAQGTGVDTSANLMGNALARAGYYIYGNREYYSNIKGRHSYFNITISDAPKRSVTSKVNILASFDAETVFQHFTEVKDYLFYDKDLGETKVENVRSMEPEITDRVAETLRKEGKGTTINDVVDLLEGKGVKTVGIRYGEIMKQMSEEMKMPLSVMERSKNIISVGASFSLLGLSQDFLFSAIKETFKNETFVKLNTLAATLGLKLVGQSFNLKPISKKGFRIQVDGNTVAAMGKIAAGLRFQSYYPITPASDESVYIEANQYVDMLDPESGDKRKGGVVIVQSEDELAAINMAIGASLTGARSATATSGPGFSLMAEGISWAGMNEVPVVVTYYMRGSPSTGLPTRSGQADLDLALAVGHGEFPRIVIASGDHVEVFKDAILSMNLAERYQTPVIHVVEKSLANAYSVLDEDSLGYDKVQVDRGKVSTATEGERFSFTDDGISTRYFLGITRELFYTGDEHNAHGHISEDSENRRIMYEKRMKKLETASREIPEEEKVRSYGDSDVVVLTWGSPKGPLLDILEEVKDLSFQVIQVRMFSPYPSSTMRRLLEGKRKIIAVENNYTGQGAVELTKHTGIVPTNYILKWTGRPIMRDELEQALREVISTGKEKVVLDAGA